MGQKEYDAFKEQLKQWIVDNQEDYNEFEDMMNELPDEGYDSIVGRAGKLMPKFRWMVQRKCNTAENLDLSDIIEVAQSERLAEKLLGEFHRKDSDNFIPAMLCWLYFGRSWEGMVEHGESILKHPSTNWFKKIYTSFMIKMLVKTSILHEFRTQEDWDKYKRLRSIISGGNIVESAIEDSALEAKNTTSNDVATQKTSTNGAFSSMLTVTSTKREALIVKVISYIESGAKGKAIAFMIIALRDLYYLPLAYSTRAIVAALQEEYGKNIGSNKGVYFYTTDDKATIFSKEIENTKSYFKVN